MVPPLSDPLATPRPGGPGDPASVHAAAPPPPLQNDVWREGAPDDHGARGTGEARLPAR